MLIPSGLRERLAALFPGSELVEAEALKPDTGTGEAHKGQGYGKPLKLRLKTREGATRTLVFHLESSNEFGHDRRADRANGVLLAWDSFPAIPHHARALDVGAIRNDGRLLPLQDVGELYLITEWAEGEVYASDLRRIANTEVAETLDLARVDALADVLLELHEAPGSHPQAYVRAIRDLVGSGEGIAGIVDSYPQHTPGASKARLFAIETQCLGWRQRLKDGTRRLRRTHGDFHPFNLVFAKGSARPTLLDTSRGSQGDPADDVTCLSINFLFFAMQHPASWRKGFGLLWDRFWTRYALGGDEELLEVTAPFFAWRALVLANPKWYPHVTEGDRDRLLRFAERALTSRRFDPRCAEEALR